MIIDTNRLLTILVDITKDVNAEVLISTKYYNIEITMYWNQLSKTRAFRHSISRQMLEQENISVDFIFERMFKSIQYEIGRIDYEN